MFANLVTPAEQRIYQMVIEGMKTDDIANVVGIQPKTVKWHLTNIYQRFEVKSRPQLVAKHFMMTMQRQQLESLSSVTTAVQDLQKMDDERKALVAKEQQSLKIHYKGREDIEKAFNKTLERMRILPDGDTAKRMRGYLMEELGYESFKS